VTPAAGEWFRLKRADDWGAVYYAREPLRDGAASKARARTKSPPSQRASVVTSRATIGGYTMATSTATNEPLTAEVWTHRPTRPGARAPDVDAPPPALLPMPPCACGCLTFTSLLDADGEPRKIAKCTACHAERDMVLDPFHGPGAPVAPPVSPWESHRAAVVDCRWFFSEAAGDLGLHCSWTQQVQQAHFGSLESAAVTMFNGQASAAPMPAGKIWAAKRWARIREVLRQITRPAHALLEYVFSLRRPDTQVAGLFDREIEPVISYLLATRQVTLAGMKEGADRSRIRTQAERQLEGALAEYEAAQRAQREPTTGTAERAAPERRRSRRDLVVAGTKGASSRRLVPIELPRAPWSPPREEA
jgi:hypothetical protein